MFRFLSVVMIAGLSIARSADAASLPTSIAQAVESNDTQTAQEKPPRPGAPTPTQTPPAPPLPLPPPAAPVAQAPPPPPPAPLPPGKAVNIQLEFTITDQSGSGAPDKKTVSMMALNGSFGRIRAGTTARPKASNPVSVHLNVDARPLIVGNDVIQTEITIEYRPVGAAMGDEPTRVDPTVLNQSLTVVLQNGKPMVITHASDPVTDRRMVVEVKATIMK